MNAITITAQASTRLIKMCVGLPAAMATRPDTEGQLDSLNKTHRQLVVEDADPRLQGS